MYVSCPTSILLSKLIFPANPINRDLLPMLSDWLEDLPSTPADFEDFYTRKADFWNDFEKAVNKILIRRYTWMNALNGNQSTEHGRYPFGDDFEDLQTDQIFDRFLAAYLRLCSTLLQADSLVLSQYPSEEICPQPLLSQKHMRSLHNIIRLEKTPISQVLHKEYNTNVRELNARMQKTFLIAGGAQNLLRLMDEVFHRVAFAVQNTYATHTSQLLSILGWAIFELPDENLPIKRTEYHRGVLSFFQKYSADISDPSKPIDANTARDLILFYSSLVHELCQWDDTIATELVDQLLEFTDPDSPTAASAVNLESNTDDDYRKDPTCYAALASNAWKFKVLRKYIVRGNMGSRVMGIATMDTALVELWREFSKIDPTCYHPVIQYLAEFLLRGQVVDYIVSVDSHPQLISRSANIAGFLVIAHRWSDSQADSVWKTVSSSPDPRVVAATMTMFRGIIQLMTTSDRLYLCTKVYELPMDRYTLDILRFFRTLTTTINEQHNVRTIAYDEVAPTARPWNICIRVIRNTAPSRHADKNQLELQAEAMNQLQYLITAIPRTERHTLYQECAQQIADGSEEATGNYRIICLLAQYPHPDDAPFFRANKDLMRSILGEIPAFVDREVLGGPHVCQISALQIRLELLKSTIIHPAMAIPEDLYEILCDHLIGEKAMSNEARDMAWTVLVHALQRSPQDGFCSQLVSSYFPFMDARFYTSGAFEFVANYNFPIARQEVQTEQGSDSLLQIPGADLLWPMLLSSTPGTIEDRVARILAIRYVKVIDMNSVTVPEVEKAHVALVEQCMQKLRTAMEVLPEQPSGTTCARHTSEVHIERILLFQKLLLGFVRQRPELNRGKRTDSKVDAMDTDVPEGDVVAVRYQCGNNRSCLTMAAKDTLDDLYRRLCHITGFTKINLFAKGQKLEVFESPTVKLSDYDFGGQVIVQRADGAEQTRTLPELAAGSSVFETAIVKYFDEMFVWMDSANTTSYLVSLLPEWGPNTANAYRSSTSSPVFQPVALLLTV
jgi:ubiquitin carboxyl-terminal hydrolase 34